MAVRIKVMSKMNIAETRAPQDGRISLMLTGRAVDSASRRKRPPWREHRAALPRPAEGDRSLDGLGLEAGQLQLLRR